MCANLVDESSRSALALQRAVSKVLVHLLCLLCQDRPKALRSRDRNKNRTQHCRPCRNSEVSGNDAGT
jgi:hypothetical protein